MTTLPSLDTLFHKSFLLKTTPVEGCADFPGLVLNHPRFPASDEFMYKIEAELASMPDAQIGLFYEKEGVIRTGRTLLEVVPTLTGTPRGRDSGDTWHQVSAIAHLNRDPVVTEFYWQKDKPTTEPGQDSGGKVAHGNGLTEDSVKSVRAVVVASPEQTPGFKLCRITRPVFALRHEIGHVFDAFFHPVKGFLLSESRRFRRIHKEDV